MEVYDDIQQKNSTIPNKLLCFGVKDPLLFLSVYKAILGEDTTLFMEYLKPAQCNVMTAILDPKNFKALINNKFIIKIEKVNDEYIFRISYKFQDYKTIMKIVIRGERIEEIKICKVNGLDLECKSIELEIDPHNLVKECETWDDLLCRLS